MRAYAEIAPLALSGDGPATMAKLSKLLQGMPGVKIVQDKGDGYLYAQCTTKLMMYVPTTSNPGSTRPTTRYRWGGLRAWGARTLGSTGSGWRR
jgi:Protein of unknown function (DUF1499)